MSPLTTEQMQDAVHQMIIHCDHLMDLYEMGAGEYTALSARSALYDLGFEADVDSILAFIAEGGFDYCLDYTIAAKHNGERPPRDACYWGADQLVSRLRSLSNIPFEAKRRRH